MASIQARFRKMAIGRKVLLLVLVVGLVPLCIGTLFSYYEGRRALESAMTSFGESRESDVLEDMEAIRATKAAQIHDLFQTIHDQAATLSKDKMVVDAMRDLSREFHAYRRNARVDGGELDFRRQGVQAYWQNQFAAELRKRGDTTGAEGRVGMLDDDSIALQQVFVAANPYPIGSKKMLDASPAASSYERVHAAVHPILRDYLDRFGYYDIFLIDAATGDVVYTVDKELDFATSLVDGPWAQTNLARVFQEASRASDPNAVAIVDFERYAPSYGEPAGFVASPIYDGREKIGVLAFQIPLDRISALMNDRTGLGETGEAYLVGADGLMRSDSYRDPEHHGVIRNNVVWNDNPWFDTGIELDETKEPHVFFNTVLHGSGASDRDEVSSALPFD